MQVDADVKRLSAENAVLLSQVRDLENEVTLASRELSNSGAPVAAVRSLISLQPIELLSACMLW